MPPLTPSECRAKRTARGLSQAALSRIAGLSDNYICRFENREFREPSGVKLAKIQAAFDSCPIPAAVQEEVMNSAQASSDQGAA